MWSARGFAVAGKAALFPSRGSRDPMELSKDSPSTLVNPNIDVRLRDAGQLRHLPDVFHGSTLIPNWEVYAGAQGGHPVVQNRDDAAQHPLLHVVRHQPSSCLGKRPWEHSSGRRWVADESASPCWAVMVSQARGGSGAKNSEGSMPGGLLCPSARRLRTGNFRGG